MAIIGKIRERSWILVGFIAAALFIFLIEAAFDSRKGGSFFSGSKNSVGKIDGNSIPIHEFNDQVTAYETGVKLLNPRMQIDDKIRGQIQDEVWYNTAMQVLIGSNLEKLGIDVTVAEMGDLMWGDHPHPLAQQMLQQFGVVDETTGKIDQAKARQILTNLKQYDPDDKQKLVETVAEMEKLIKEETIKSKYTALVSKSFYMPTFVAKEIVNSSRGATASLVSVPYTSLPDDKYKVSDDEIASYIKDNAAKYQQEESRTLDVVTFDITPSAADTAVAKKKVEQLRSDFFTTSNDSAFIARNSVQATNLTFYSKEDIQQTGRNADTLFSFPVGTTTGIYRAANYFLFTKIIDRTVAPDTVRAAHILLSEGNGSEQEKAAANRMADSLIALIESKKVTFGDVAFQNSKDENSKKKGGDLGYFGRNRMVKEFNDLVFFKGMMPGEIRKVESQYGLHIVLLLDARSPKPMTKFADFVAEIIPGKETEKDVYAKATAFTENNDTPDKFDKAIKTMNAYKDIVVQPNTVEVMNLGPARQIVQWAFQQKEAGAIKFFDMSSKFVVVKLNKVTEKGLAKPEDVRDDVVTLVRNEKKGKDLVEQLSKAEAGSTDLHSIAAKIKGAQVLDTVKIRYAGGFIMGVGNEPKMVGAAFGTPVGKLSKPVAGTDGAFIVQPSYIEEQSTAAASGDINNYKMQMQYSAVMRMNFQSILESIMNKANVEDKRYMFY